jgi:hypothetical protein
VHANFMVGDHVYRAYSPGKHGVITEDLGQRQFPGYTPDSFISYQAYVVRWLKGGESIERWSSLRLFNELIADHEKKLETHRAAKAAFIAFCEKEGLAHARD